MIRLGKVKSYLWNRFMLQFAMGHFLEHPVKNVDPRLLESGPEISLVKQGIVHPPGGTGGLKMTNDNYNDDERRDGRGRQEDNMWRTRVNQDKKRP